ncbi:MAG: hypothetical protein LBC95_00740 [Candidatus Nomurabacteria bacterium]|jgi:hypothetical protein|nr:hypothetical protein [Candidatus Nomurabacteria bacterium]
MKKSNFFDKIVEYKISDNYRLFALPDFITKIQNGAGSANIKYFNDRIYEIAELDIEYPQKRSLLVTMIVIPREIYAELSGNPYGQSINGSYNPFDKIFRTALYIDEQSFENWIFERLAILHELSHVVHGAFFSLELREGFAEMLPFYILDLEKEYPEHARKIADLLPEEILTIKEVRQRGYNPPNVVKENLPISLRPAYIATYLLMRGILQRLTKEFGGDKIVALNRMLTKFAEFSVLAKRMELKDEMIWRFAGLDAGEDYRTLQLEAQAEIVELAKELPLPSYT